MSVGRAKLLLKQVFQVQSEVENKEKFYEVELWEDGGVSITEMNEYGDLDETASAFLTSDEVKLVCGVFAKAKFFDVDEQNAIKESSIIFLKEIDNG